MAFHRIVNRMLHDEHMAVVALLERFGHLLATHRAEAPPATDRAAAALLRELDVAIEHELAVHFAFEERELFPLLVDMGEEALPAALEGEHAEILPMAQRVAAYAHGGLDGPSGAAAWTALQRSGSALVEMLTAHAEKEEMGLLPALEEALDEETDARLAGAYAVVR